MPLCWHFPTPHPRDYSVTIVKIASYLLGRSISWFVYVWPWLIIHSDWHEHLINLSVLFRAPPFYLLFAGLFSLFTLLDLILFPYVLGWDFPYYVFSINITAFIFSSPKSRIHLWLLFCYPWCYELKPLLFLYQHVSDITLGRRE